MRKCVNKCGSRARTNRPGHCIVNEAAGKRVGGVVVGRNRGSEGGPDTSGAVGQWGWRLYPSCGAREVSLSVHSIDPKSHIA